jgi:hypothetical protein
MDNINYIKVWCEYDIGQDNVIFESIENARKWAYKMLEQENFLEEGEKPEYIEKIGFLYYDTVTLINDEGKKNATN